LKYLVIIKWCCSRKDTSHTDVKVNENSKGERESKAKHFEEKYGVKWPFSEGWVLVLITKSSA